MIKKYGGKKSGKIPPIPAFLTVDSVDDVHSIMMIYISSRRFWRKPCEGYNFRIRKSPQDLSHELGENCLLIVQWLKRRLAILFTITARQTENYLILNCSI